MFKRLFFSLMLVAVLFFAWFFVQTRPVTYKDMPTVEFEIQTGWGLDRIGQELSTNHLIRSRSAFKITVVVMGFQNRIQAGYFRLSPNMTITTIAQKLTRASSKQVRVTLQEGLRREEVAEILNNSFKNQEGSRFSVQEFLAQTKGKEGYLFPDTYDFSPKADASEVLSKLTSQFTKVANTIGITPDNEKNTLIIASLLEREAASSSEMPQIAGVILNRLNADWPLQIDATVQYALSSKRCSPLGPCDWWPNSLTKNDLDISSPFNTYKNLGLPPAPIVSPGKNALEAALRPQSTSAWFYLHDLSGKIHFAKTIEEHNQNVCRHLRKDCP